MRNKFEFYIEEQIKVLKEMPLNSIKSSTRMISDSITMGRQMFIFGNGGSAANASHFAMELGKNAAKKDKVRIFCLNDNVEWMTAIANDKSFDDIFLHPLTNLARSGDLIIVLSTSGRSPNVIKPVVWAKESNNSEIIAITGGVRQNALQSLADVTVAIPSYDSGMIENVQQIVCHMIISMLSK